MWWSTPPPSLPEPLQSYFLRLCHSQLDQRKWGGDENFSEKETTQIKVKICNDDFLGGGESGVYFFNRHRFGGQKTALVKVKKIQDKTFTRLHFSITFFGKHKHILHTKFTTHLTMSLSYTSLPQTHKHTCKIHKNTHNCLSVTLLYLAFSLIMKIYYESTSWSCWLDVVKSKQGLNPYSPSSKDIQNRLARAISKYWLV